MPYTCIMQPDELVAGDRKDIKMNTVARHIAQLCIKKLDDPKFEAVCDIAEKLSSFINVSTEKEIDVDALSGNRCTTISMMVNGEYFLCITRVEDLTDADYANNRAMISGLLLGLIADGDTDQFIKFTRTHAVM